MSFSLNDYLHFNKVRITTTSGMTLTGKFTKPGPNLLFVFIEDQEGRCYNYFDKGINTVDYRLNIEEIVEVNNPTAPLQLKVKRCHEYVLTVDEQFHTSLVELAKKLNKTEPQLIQDALNFYFNTAKEWEKNNR